MNVTMRTIRASRHTRLLAAALLVTAGFSAGMRHAHPGGDRWHDHHDAGLVARSAHEAFDSVGWSAAPLHMHIFLLGFQFTMPAEEGSDHEPTAGSDHPVLVRLIGDDLSDSAARAPLATCEVAARHTLIDSDRQPVRLAPFDPASFNSQPLCDAARHERSGVQRS